MPDSEDYLNYYINLESIVKEICSISHPKMILSTDALNLISDAINGLNQTLVYVCISEFNALSYQKGVMRQITAIKAVNQVFGAKLKDGALAEANTCISIYNNSNLIKHMIYQSSPETKRKELQQDIAERKKKKIYIEQEEENVEKRDCIPGLLNLGNSCFLNAVLQALAACPSSVTWLQKIVSSASESALNENFLLIKALLSILRALNSEDDVCSGEHVVEALRAHRWIISNEEQDAHELFHVLTSTIEEELKSAKPVLSLLDAGKLEDDGGGEKCNTQVPSKSFISSKKPDHCRLASPVCGLLVSELKCNICNSKYPARYDNFDSISLAIPTPHWAHLQDLLMKFISRELVQDVICDFCTKQNKESAEEENNPEILKSVFTKQLSFGKLPKCLCIHIQRTVWLKNGVSVKNYEYVAFPEVLVMDYFVHRHVKKNIGIDANYMQLRLTGGNAVKNEQNTSLKLPDMLNEEISIPSKESPEEVKLSPANVETELNSETYKYVYLLKAVIVHLGDTSSGHFITYRRGAMNNQQQSKWYYISDAEVKEVSYSEVSRACAYMLFYESISDQKS